MAQISKHISLIEATKSHAAIRHGVPNIPNEIDLANMKLVAKKCFEPLREHFGVPIGITSFYRNRFVNILVKGSPTSQHMQGKAIDIDADIFGQITNKEIYEWLLKNVPFDQLIWEYGDSNNPAWVHISYNQGNNRKQTLRVR